MQFIFLYPTPDIIEYEILRGMHWYWDEEKEQKFLRELKEIPQEEQGSLRKAALEARRAEYRAFYGERLNACIDARYRSKGFDIAFAVFDGSPVSDVIDVRLTDRVIEVGMDAATHETEQPDGEYLYPDEDGILNQLRGNVIRIGGFHMWHCVERLARRAYERGMDVLVDSDLTDFFRTNLMDPDFKVETPGKFETFIYEEVEVARPWLQ